MWNTIILEKGEERLTSNEYKKFEKGDTIWGNDNAPKEIKRWSINQKEEAIKELEKYNCSYKKYNQSIIIEEYALNYCNCDENGEMWEGSDYDLAEEKDDTL